MSEVVWEISKGIAPIFILVLFLMGVIVIIKLLFIKTKDNIIDRMSERCPECGGHLKKKKGKYGYFIGCSNYPNCNYTRKINN